MPVEERRRVTGLEWRAGDPAGGPGVLSGTVIRFGDVGTLPWGQEAFARGSVELDDGGVILNRQHDRARPLSRWPDGGMEISISPEAVRMRARIADTQDGRDAVALVRAGIMRGLSVEFVPEDEGVEGGVRIIRRARVVGVGVVDDGTYPASEVSAMRERFRSSAHEGSRVVRVPWWW